MLVVVVVVRILDSWLESQECFSFLAVVLGRDRRGEEIILIREVVISEAQ